MTLLTFPDQFSTEGSFPSEPTRFTHGLADHPLLSLAALAELARRLDGDRVEYNAGDVEPGQNPEDVRAIDLEPAEVVRQIESCGAWMVLKNVESQPEYRALVDNFLKDAAAGIGCNSLAAASIDDIQGFIFVASAQSVTPFHVDYENNLFVHLAGPKAMHVFDNRDRSFVSEADLETYPGKHRNLTYRPDFEDRAMVFDFQPGDGLFMPYAWPHWVRTGDRPAVSMAITWKTRKILDRNALLFANAFLRDAGLPQPVPERFPVFDRVKTMAIRTARAIIDPLRRSEHSRRLLRGLLFGRKANYYYNRPAEKA